MIHVGEPSELAIELRDAVRAAIDAATSLLAPGITIGRIADAIVSSVRGQGYEIEFPIGHTVGVDLVLHRLLPEYDQVLHEHDTVIIHPRLRARDGSCYFFWGETYLVTNHGNRRLHASDDDLHTVL